MNPQDHKPKKMTHFPEGKPRFRMPFTHFSKPIKLTGVVSTALAGISLITPLLNGCTTPEAKAETPPVTQSSNPADHVLVVINKASTDSIEIGAYYRAKREIPKENVLFIDVSTTENVDDGEFKNGILEPIKTAIRASRSRIDYIVTTKGVPLRIKDNNGYSVDAFIAAMNLTFPPITDIKETDQIRRAINPYYRADESFNSDKYKMYLVTRLTGYTVADAKKLVDNSVAAKKVDGPFFFDLAGNRNNGGYLQLQTLMKGAHAQLTEKGLDSQIDEDKEFQLPGRPLMGYCSWGSNDGAFSLDTYRKIQFLPGSICETFVSTSGRTFRPTTGGQSLIADLIANGVTGIKGYVSEPYTFALAEPDILFPRYTSGRNLAESFYSASKVLKWKDIVIGDPLCAPYKQ